MSIFSTRLQCLGLLAAMILPGLVWAEGSVELGAEKQGLESPFSVIVHLEEGDTLKVCSSDDTYSDEDTYASCGNCEPVSMGGSYELSSNIANCEFPTLYSCSVQPFLCPTIANLKNCANRLIMEERARVGAHILAFPPNPKSCASDDVCPSGYHCHNARTGLPASISNLGGSATSVNAYKSYNKCGIRIKVDSAHNIAYCDASTGPRNWWSRVGLTPGDWSINFMGEPDIAYDTGGSTRYFDIQVVDSNQRERKGRAYSLDWWLNAHRYDYEVPAQFYVVSPAATQAHADAAHVFMIDFHKMAGYRWQLAANNFGMTVYEKDVNGNYSSRDPRKSWCAYGSPNDEHECLNVTGSFATNSDQSCYTDGWDNDGDDVGDGNCTAKWGGSYKVYLNYPDPAPQAPDPPQITDLKFTDEVGSTSISPNGDGNQDEGYFEFKSNIAGTYRIIVDTDRPDNADEDPEYKPVFDPSKDWWATGQASMSRLVKVPWDGRDAHHQVVKEGNYAFQVTLVSGEIHFPMQDIENNSWGFRLFKAFKSDTDQSITKVPVRMYWDDSNVREQAHLLESPCTANWTGSSCTDQDWDESQSGPYLDTVTSWPDGSLIPDENGQGVHQYRVWRQRPSVHHASDSSYPADMITIFDTFAYGEVISQEVVPTGNQVILGDDIPQFNHDEQTSMIRIAYEGSSTHDEAMDSDGDGVADSVEQEKGTNSQSSDSDGDGLSDYIEVYNILNLGTDPTKADSDNDGLPDGKEYCPPSSPTEGHSCTDPMNPDTDGDGIKDGEEFYSTCLNPNQPDTDGDGLKDGIERGVTADGVSFADATITDPCDEDSDKDGLPDGIEDANHDGVYQETETHPLKADTDCDGKKDGEEDVNHNGIVDEGETDPRQYDCEQESCPQIDPESCEEVPIIIEDSTVPDSGVEDSGIELDSHIEQDSDVNDGSIDSGLTDTGSIDSGLTDTGSIDSGLADTGSIDSGLADTGSIDAGPAIDTGIADAGSTDSGSGTDASHWRPGREDASSLDASAPAEADNEVTGDDAGCGIAHPHSSCWPLFCLPLLLGLRRKH